MQSFNKMTMSDQLVIFTFKPVYGSRLILVYCITDKDIMIKTRFNFFGDNTLFQGQHLSLNR